MRLMSHHRRLLAVLTVLAAATIAVEAVPAMASRPLAEAGVHAGPTAAAIRVPSATGSASLRRYVSFGDSVPYGHGLANPETGKNSGLPAEQGPSPDAWPSLVDKGVPGLAPLKLRPTSCGLTDAKGAPYDQLAFSGAPTQPNKWTGADSTCAYPKGTKVPLHKAVVPNEISAALSVRLG
jgi:hypothetical protein